MGIVCQKDKRSGITYAYESKAYWDKEKKQSRAKRTLIGRVEPDTGEIVPTDGRVRKARERLAEPDYKALQRVQAARAVPRRGQRRGLLRRLGEGARVHVKLIRVNRVIIAGDENQLGFWRKLTQLRGEF